MLWCHALGRMWEAAGVVCCSSYCSAQPGPTQYAKHGAAAMLLHTDNVELVPTPLLTGSLRRSQKLAWTRGWRSCSGVSIAPWASATATRCPGWHALWAARMHLMLSGHRVQSL